MSRVKTLQSLFKRYRRPGDIVFAWLILIFSILMLSQIGDQTAYKNGGKLFAQPRFWPAVSLGLMTVFATLHLLGSALSDRIEGRWREVLSWLAAFRICGLVHRLCCFGSIWWLPSNNGLVRSGAFVACRLSKCAHVDCRRP